MILLMFLIKIQGMYSRIFTMIDMDI